MALKVGITGGIGSGKTTVCKMFEALGVPVYYADDRAKALMMEAPLMASIINLLGEEAYVADGVLDRNFVSRKIFSEPKLLEALNQLVHPAVHEDGLQWQSKHQDAPITLKEAAILYESESYKNMDKVITVFAPQALRIQRVMQRNQWTKAQVLERMLQQIPEEEKMVRADFIIFNNERQLLMPQVLRIFHSLSHMENTTKR